MEHKYLENLVDIKETPYGWCSDNDKREEHWKNEQRLYGFDSRETWSLNTTFIYWLYERLMMFKEYAHIDLDFHKFNINGEELTQGQCIDKILEYCKQYILTDNYDNYKLIDKVLDIWKKCVHSMWW